MSRDKQIEEMAKAVCHLDRTCDECMTSFECKAMMYAKRFYDAGYRKIYDDHQRQCTCYALGCQMAEELKRKVAREIFEEAEKIFMATCLSLETYKAW